MSWIIQDLNINIVEHFKIGYQMQQNDAPPLPTQLYPILPYPTMLAPTIYYPNLLYP